MFRHRVLGLVAVAGISLSAAGCTDVYFDLKPGDCVREKGLGLSWEDGVEKISCSEHNPLDLNGKTWVVKATGDVNQVDAACPTFGIVIADGDYAVCYSVR